MGTRCQVRRPAVKKLASLQQAPGRLHDETWAGRAQRSNLLISQVVEIVPGCADTASYLPPLFLASVSPGPGREVRNGMGWTLLEKTTRSGLWRLRAALGEAGFSLRLLQLETGPGKDPSLQLGRSSRSLRVLAHIRMGKARLSGHNLESGVDRY